MADVSERPSCFRENPNGVWEWEFRRGLETYFEFRGLDNISPEENAADLASAIRENCGGLSLKEAAGCILKKPRWEMFSRGRSHPVTDYDAVFWAACEADMREEIEKRRQKGA